jgi:hypothetical protein
VTLLLVVIILIVIIIIKPAFGLEIDDLSEGHA